MSTIIDEAVVAISYKYSQASESKVLSGIGKVSAAVAGVLAATAKWTLSLSESIDAQGKAAQSLGLTAEAYQEWTFAAERSGLQAEQLRVLFGRLSQGAAELAQGTGATGEQLARLGIAALDPLTGSMRSAADLAVDLSDSLNNLGDAERQATLQKLFGEQGGRLGVLLGEGSKGLEALFQRQRELGIFSEELAGQSAQLQDSWLDLKRAGTGLALVAGGELIPALTPIITTLTELIVANKGVISSGIVAFADTMANTFELMVTPLGMAATGIGGIAAAIGTVSTAGSIVSAMAGASPVVAAFVGSITGISAPVIAGAAAVAGLVLVIGDLYQASRGNGSYLQGFIDSIGLSVDVGETATAVYEDLAAQFNVLYSAISLVGAGIRLFAINAVYNIGTLAGAIDALIRQLSGIGIGEVLDRVSGGMVSGLQSRTGVFNSISSLLDGGTAGLMAAGDAVAQGRPGLSAFAGTDTRMSPSSSALSSNNVTVSAPLNVQISGSERREIEREIRRSQEAQYRQLGMELLSQ